MDILDSIQNFINMGTTGALMIEGAWGCGKTYCLEHTVFPALYKQEKLCVRVSLFGIKDVSEIPAKVLQAFMESAVSGKTKKNFKLGNVTSLANKVGELFPKIKEYVDITKMVAQGNMLYTLVPKDTIICFDDLERAADTINLNDLLGAVNELVENRHYKVILVANKDYIDSKYSPSSDKKDDRELFYEKVVEKTIVFEPEIKTIYKQLVKEHKDDAFTAFMLGECNISKVDPALVKSKALKKHFQNLRTLKFSIEHFYKLWQQLDTTDIDKEDSLSYRKLKNIWTFIHAVAVEMKKNELKHDDDKGISQFYELVLDSGKEDDDELFSDEYETKEKESKSDNYDYSNWFKKVYYESHNEPFLFYPSIYGFITASRNLNKEEIEYQAKKAFEIKNNELSEGQAILGTILTYGYWSYNNEQSHDNLLKLFNCVSKGDLRDYSSFYNAGVYLFGFKEIIGKTDEDLKKAFEKGIKAYTKILPEVSFLTTTNVRMLPQNTPEAKWMCNLIQDCIDNRIASDHKKEAETLEEEFLTNLEKFATRFIPTSMSTPEHMNEPVLANLNNTKVKKRMHALEPNEVMCLYSMVKSRYLEIDCTRIYKEESFLNAMLTGLNSIDLEKPLMSNITIKKYLLPVLTKAISICRMINNKINASQQG